MQLPFEVEAAVSQLSPDLRAAFERDYSGRRLSITWAYVLWGVVGGHYAYLRDRRRQTVFLLTLGGFGVWWAVDAVRIPRLVAQVNADRARALAAQYRTLAMISPRREPTAQAVSSRGFESQTKVGVGAADRNSSR